MARNFKRQLFIEMEDGKTVSYAKDTDLRIDFAIEQSTMQTPDPAQLKLYNVGQGTVGYFKNKEGTTLKLYAGYEGNVGFLYEGQIKQTLAGKENGVTSYLSIFTGSEDQAYRQSRMSKTLAKGYTPMDKINVALESMQPFGITGLGYINVDLSTPVYPRGRPIVGMTRDLIRQVALSAGATWSMQNNKLNIVDIRKPLQTGNTFVLNSQTGLIGIPEQTEDGITFRSLINPALVLYGTVQINQDEINQAQLDTQAIAGGNGLTGPRNTALQMTGALDADGLYRIMWMRRYGSTRGQEWYDEGLAISVSQGHPTQQQLTALSNPLVLNAR